MPDVMVDLETLGTRPGCAIMSIGAVEFSSTGIGRCFYTHISRESCRKAGLYEDSETMDWWSRQSPEAKQLLTAVEDADAPTLLLALLRFSVWLAEGSVYEPTRLWGNGAAFDNAILHVAYSAVEQNPAWEFHNDRCFRTLKAMGARSLEPERQGTFHHALDDAVHQARWAIALNDTGVRVFP